MKPNIIVLTGPTAVGKTALSIALAKKVNGEIISADSMQVYKKMDIGTAKIMPEEMSGIPHYLVDILDPGDEFNVTVFQKKAKEAIKEIQNKGKIPILVGGTGFYIQAILKDIDFTKENNNGIYRKQWEEYLTLHGVEALHKKLQEVDGNAALAIHPNNTKRVIRALEYFSETGMRISDHNEQEKQKKSPYLYAYFVLNDKRELLYQRIDQRVDEMVQQGLVSEVTNLRAEGYTKDLVSMQGLGYKEIFDYLDGNCTLEEAIYVIKRDTRHFAKRQLTWFQREESVDWVYKPDFGYDNHLILEYMVEKMKEKGMLRHE